MTDAGRAQIEELIRRSKAGDLEAFGYKPSELAPTHFLASEHPAAAPPAFLHPGYRKVPVRSQQGGTCVSNSCSTCLTLLEFVEKNDIVNFDAEAWSARAVGKDYGPGAAASPHDLLDDAIKHGVTSTLGGVQGNYYPKAYAWLDYTNRAAIQEAMSTPGQVVTGALWLQNNFGTGGKDADGQRDAFNGSVFAPYVDGNPWGLHEITFVGYEERGLIFQNSWGTWWGDGGFGRLTWEHMAKRGTEMLTITDNPDNAGGFVKTFDWGTLPEVGIKRPDLPERKRPAVYLVKNNGRIWIKDPTEAKRMGVDLSKIKVLPDTAYEWGLPVIGLDAPRNQR